MRREWNALKAEGVQGSSESWLWKSKQMLQKEQN